jgi:hypothetical protein
MAGRTSEIAGVRREHPEFEELSAAVKEAE